MAEVRSGIVASKQFIDDINTIQDVYVFRITLSNYDENKLEEITQEDIDQQLQELGTIDAETYLNDDLLSVHIYKGDLFTEYKSILFFYTLNGSSDKEDQKFAFIAPIKKGDYANTDLQDYTHNWIYLSLRGFDLKCKFILPNLPESSIFHDHSTTPFDTVDQSIKLADLKDYKDRVFPLIENNSETVNPTVIDGSFKDSSFMRILPNGTVINNNQVIFTPKGNQLLPDNLNVMKQVAIAQEDKFIDI